MTIEITRLPAQNNQPHQWSWKVVITENKTREGVENSKKEAIQATIAALESLK